MEGKPKTTDLIRQRIEQLEQSKIILNSKITRLEELRRITDKEIEQLKKSL